MAEHSPAPGDLLIAKRSPEGDFEISIVPGRPQLTVSQQHDAVKQAQAFAARSAASVWILDGTSYVRMKPQARKES